jgi:gluconate 2-dehydrogenase gamma chain
MIERRRVLQALGVGAVVPASVPAQQVPAQDVNRSEGGWQFFSARDGEFIAAAVDRLIPPDRHPGAAEAGVPIYIDRQLAGPYGAGARMYLQGPFERGTPQQGYQMGMTPAQLYRAALDGLQPHLQGRAFGQRSEDERDTFLKRLEAGELMLGEVPSAVFFETLLANTIEGYFADPMYGGNRNMAGWRMVGFPGAYAAFVQWVDQHGVRFERPPMSIAMSQHTGSHGHGHGGK